MLIEEGLNPDDFLQEMESAVIDCSERDVVSGPGCGVACLKASQSMFSSVLSPQLWPYFTCLSVLVHRYSIQIPCASVN